MAADFRPDYRNLVDALHRKRPRRLPLYEHNVYPNVLEAIIGRQFSGLASGDAADKREYFRTYSAALSELGYDVVPFEGCIVELVQGGEALCGRAGALFGSLEQIEEYDWDGLVENYFRRFGPDFEALAESLPAGMMAVAGVGNGVFECIQDFVPMTDLAYLEADDPEAYELLWSKVADLLAAIWKQFIPRYGDSYCAFRMGDDLGFKSSLLIRPQTIRKHIIPAYRRIADLCHREGKPFLLHSCGRIFEVMDDIIAGARIDGKHSNEDTIAPFSEWLARYGDRVALFGGIDMDLLCRESPAVITERVGDLLEEAKPYPGFALGSGNQIAEYVPPAGFVAMVEAARRFRGE
ncbi:MAG TPA: uroporphyrinogen decarboxylase family protein [Spirochaetia bacterium]|nr:uroporphyrinogen decarboxylase family protein [Spirochaetia bacterium]